MRSFYFSLFMVFIFTTPSYALVCERTHFNPEGFISPSAAEYWHPKKLRIPDRFFKQAGGGSEAYIYHKSTVVVRGEIRIMRYRLLPDGRLFLKMQKAPGYKETKTNVYRCDKSARDLTEYYSTRNFYSADVDEPSQYRLQTMDLGSREIHGLMTWDNYYSNYETKFVIKKNELTMERATEEQLCIGHFFKTERNTARAKMLCPNIGSVTVLMIFEDNEKSVRVIGFDNNKNEFRYKGEIVN